MEEDRSRISGLKLGKSESGKDSLMNICLIGMPSSGKSVLGVLLAKKLGMSFLDMDLVIQEKTGQLLREIIAERGREGFLLLEEEVGAELSMNNTVLARRIYLLWQEGYGAFAGDFFGDFSGCALFRGGKKNWRPGEKRGGDSRRLYPERPI